MKDIINTLFHGANGAFVWGEHVSEIIMTALLSMVPTFEGRYALVAARTMGMPVIPAYLIAVLFSSIPVPFILWLRL